MTGSHPSRDGRLFMICIVCEDEFNEFSAAKRAAGGLRTQCPDCSKESVVKYAGVSSGDGKGSQVNVLSFSSTEDRAKYISFWQSTSGLHKGKSCQLSKHASTDPGIKFNTISAVIPTNHKGKM